MKKRAIKFSVVTAPHDVPKSGSSRGVLLIDNWDDWFEFSTMYVLFVFDHAGERHDCGQVKIGQFAMGKNQRRPAIPAEFDVLTDDFFSLGQDESYYVALSGLDSELRDDVLHALRDMVADLELFDKAQAERVTSRSLLRSVAPSSVRGQYRRILDGGARLTSYKFSYQAPEQGRAKGAPPRLDFSVVPDSQPPTNIHVLIGRNGVGKTYLLSRMTRALVEEGANVERMGQFIFESADPGDLFANLVSITFSAFDPFRALPERRDRRKGIKYSYIGIKRASKQREGVGIPKSIGTLAKEFAASMKVCTRGARVERWRRALQTLETDPLFKAAEIAALADEQERLGARSSATALFRGLSSGHKIVLLTITRLVETVEERTLVLLDEPEAHLHPPLLSAFIRALSDLLVHRNGVAIVATHSPVVLQEVPQTCVWKLRRSGVEANAERPEIETFGENVGVLTREVFGLEVTHSGFHKMVEGAVADQPSFDGVLARFGGKLGGEARAIARALATERSADQAE